MSDRAKVRVVIEYETTLGDDAEAYEGETTPEGKAAKEVEYITDGGDYLIQALNFLPHTLDATVELIKDED